MAASLDLQVSTGQHPPDRISSCPDAVLSDIEVTVTNLGGQTDTVMLTLDWPSDLGFIKPHQTLASGETVTIDPFWITLPYNLEPGIYHAKVAAESSMSGDIVTRDIEIEVMRCHSVGIAIDDDYGRSCQETQEPVVYDIEITNQGKWSESFDLSASVDWAEFSQESVTVESEESYIVSLVLNPPEGISPGKHTVFVTARSTESYAVATAPLEMEVVECLDFTAELEPEGLDACLGESRDYELIITNTGEEEDEFVIDAPDWAYPDRTKTELDVGESDIIIITVVPDKRGVQIFEVTVTSERDQLAAPKTLSGIIDVEECRGVAVILSPSELAVCRGDSAELSVSIKNTGSLEGTFLVTSTFGKPASDSITLDAGESKTITLDVDTSELPEGTVVIEVTASDGEITDTATAELVLEECYTAELSLQPDAVIVCPGARIPYTIKIKNTGKKTDEYTLEFAEESINVSLEPDKSHVISHDYEIPYIEEGRYLFTAELSSGGGISLLETSEISLRSSEACYGVELVDGPGVVDVGKATTIEMTIRNTGEQADRFMVTMEGPDWAYIEPTEVRLDGMEEDSLYLYLSPGFGTLEGTYNVTIKAESDHASDGLEISVNVPENITEAPEEPELQPPEEPPEGEGPEAPENVSINVTHPSEEAPITGEVIEERPFWKTAAVAVIALIIVLILALRFVLLFKK